MASIVLSDFISQIRTVKNESHLTAKAEANQIFPKTVNFICGRCDMIFSNLTEYKSHYASNSHLQKRDDKTYKQESGLPLFTRVEEKNGRVILNLKDASYSVWRCFFKEPIGEYDIKTHLDDIKSLENSMLLIILFRAGRFSAGIYNVDGSNIIKKTLKRYTVRGKQGKGQSSAGGSKSYHSAGSMLRSNNESLLKEVYRYMV